MSKRQKIALAKNESERLKKQAAQSPPDVADKLLRVSSSLMTFALALTVPR